MKTYIKVGKIINTFGIKGELKVLSDFEFKDRIFTNDFALFIGDNKIKETINNHRVHKGLDLILLNNYSNINEVLKYKNKIIYIDKDDLKLNPGEYLLSDLINFDVYDNDKIIGKVIDYEKNKAYSLLKIMGEKTFYIPNIPDFIIDIDFKDKKIITNKGSDLIL